MTSRWSSAVAGVPARANGLQSQRVGSDRRTTANALAGGAKASLKARRHDRRQYGDVALAAARHGPRPALKSNVPDFSLKVTVFHDGETGRASQLG